MLILATKNLSNFLSLLGNWTTHTEAELADVESLNITIGGAYRSLGPQIANSSGS